MTTQMHAHVPTTLSAASTVHISGHRAGEIRLDCRFSPGCRDEDVREYARLSIPGEAGMLRPNDVVRENDRFVVGFFSSDIANAGHVPASVEVHWVDGDSTHKLADASVQSAIAASAERSDDAVRVPGGHPASRYPFTVVAVPALMLTIVVISACILMLL